MAEGVSVIVCSFNSAKRIAETLRYLSEQHVPAELLWEVLVVNNASSDNTKAIAFQSWKNTSSNVAFQVVDEPVPGLSSARLRGIKEAKYDILIFCDDDNHLDPNYVFLANEMMQSKKDVGVLGGWVKPKLPNNLDPWIKDFYPALAIGKQAEKDGYVQWVFGAGMIIRKEIFEKLKDQKIELMLSDRLGSKQTSGGDVEICVAARFAGYAIYSSNQLILHHQISAHRLTKKSFIKANYCNVFPLIYLYLMESLVKNPTESVVRMYRKFFSDRISMIFYFLPRLILGKHRFYSFMMLYQNIQLFFWLLTRRKYFRYTASAIKKNLYRTGE